MMGPDAGETKRVEWYQIGVGMGVSRDGPGDALGYWYFGP